MPPRRRQHHPRLFHRKCVIVAETHRSKRASPAAATSGINSSAIQRTYFSSSAASHANSGGTVCAASSVGTIRAGPSCIEPRQHPQHLQFRLVIQPIPGLRLNRRRPCRAASSPDAAAQPSATHLRSPPASAPPSEESRRPPPQSPGRSPRNPLLKLRRPIPGKHQMRMRIHKPRRHASPRGIHHHCLRRNPALQFGVRTSRNNPPIFNQQRGILESVPTPATPRPPAAAPAPPASQAGQCSRWQADSRPRSTFLPPPEYESRIPAPSLAQAHIPHPHAAPRPARDRYSAPAQSSSRANSVPSATVTCPACSE